MTCTRVINGRGHLECWLCALVLIAGQSAVMRAQPPRPSPSSCSKDYPVPTTSIKYEEAFASETLIPDRISLDGKAVRPGGTEKDLGGVLGSNAVTVEDGKRRSDEEQCDYLLGILRGHPNSMYLYRIGSLRLKRMSGVFRVVEWKLEGIGSLRALFNIPTGGGEERSYLFLLNLAPTSSRSIQRLRGEKYVLTRTGKSRITWDVETNSVSVSTRSP